MTGQFTIDQLHLLNVAVTKERAQVHQEEQTAAKNGRGMDKERLEAWDNLLAKVRHIIDRKEALRNHNTGRSYR